MSGAQTPPGWHYNPSTWRERLPIIGLAMAGALIAAYLAAYQLGIFGSVWEPFFGNGSVRILHSPVSRLLPIPDAALGALGYLADAVSGAIGGRDRWRSMPWLVILFGLAVGPLGVVSITLVSALISLTMIGPAMDEVLASLQHIRRVGQAGRSRWRAFWGIDRAPVGAER